MMSLTSQPTLLSFRIFEAIFGTSPAGVESSLRNYCIYHATPLECTIDERTKRPMKVAKGDVYMKTRSTLISFCLLVALISGTMPSFAPFDVRVPAHTLDHYFSDLFHLGHLANNYISSGTVTL